MKKILLLAGILVSLTAVSIVFAQSPATGVIEYEVKVNLHRTLPPGREEMKAILPEFRTSKQQLFFNESESLYKPVIEDEDEEQEGGARIMIRQPNNEVYFNQTSGKNIAKEEFFGKTYLIEDSAKIVAWKFGTEVKTIQGYECQQAYYTDESNPNRKQEVTAWYTAKLRPSLGPERFFTLPGAVLAVDINNGERVTVAKKIQLRELKKNELKAPTSGEKISRAEFIKVRDEQLKKMNASGGMIIRN